MTEKWTSRINSYILVFALASAGAALIEYGILRSQMTELKKSIANLEESKRELVRLTTKLPALEKRVDRLEAIRDANTQPPPK